MNALDRFSLKNKVVLLTGGAGLYGRGLAADLASAGATLIVASRNRESCQQVADEENAQGHAVSAESFDQGEESSILELKERILARFGRIDGLVNNSVVRSMFSPDAPVADWETSMRVNATGVMLMHRVFGAAMCQQKSGSIVNVGSMQGMIGPKFSLYEGTNMKTPSPDYFFHKAGMINLTRYYAALFGQSNVRVNCLSPGGFFNNQPEPFLSNYNKSTYLGRMGNPTDLGGSVIFLLSEASAYITAVNIPVDGGYTAH